MADGNLGPLEWAENRKEGVAPVEKPHYPCPAFNGNPVVQSACVRVSAQPVGNRTYCVANNCQSPWRVTLAPGTVAPAPRAPVVARAPATPPPTRVTLETTTAIPRAVVVAPTPPVTQKPPPSDSAEEVVGRIVRAPVGRIRRFEGQPREEFDEDELKSLAKSIKERKQLVPALLVEVFDDPDIDYQVVDGERRWISCKMAGVSTLLGIIYDGLSVDEAKELYEASVMANFNRSAHTPIETAKVCHRLMHDHRHTYAEVHEITGLAISAIEYHLKLLKLDPDVQAMMRKDSRNPTRNLLKIGHALLLLDYAPSFQKTVAAEIVQQGLNYNRAGYYVRKRAIELGARRDGTTRDYRPSDHYDVFMSGLGRVHGRLATYLDLPEMSLRNVFERRTAKERTEASEMIERTILILDQMKQEILGQPQDTTT